MRSLFTRLVQTLLRPVLRITNPFLISPVFDLLTHHTLGQLTNKADKVVSPERILPLPLPPLLLLAIQHLLISDLARLCPQILTHGQQIEPDLVRWIALDAPLQDGDDLVRKVLWRAGAVVDGRWLQAVELVQRAVDSGVGDEVVDVVVVGGGALLVADERRRPRERVVRVADQIRVRERFAS